jgi:hypothetical protein
MGSIKQALDDIAKKQMGRGVSSNDTLDVFKGKINAPAQTVMGTKDLGKNLFDYLVKNAGKGMSTDWKSVQSFADKSLDMGNAAKGMYTLKIGSDTLSLQGPASADGQVPDVRQLRIVGRE